MIQYEYDRTGLFIEEKQNENDVEFVIRIQEPDRYLQAIHDVRSHFEQNTVYTDVLFYTHPNHVYQVIVRQDYYVDFLACLFKNRLLHSLAWKQ